MYGYLYIQFCYFGSFPVFVCHKKSCNLLKKGWTAQSVVFNLNEGKVHPPDTFCVLMCVKEHTHTRILKTKLSS